MQLPLPAPLKRIAQNLLAHNWHRHPLFIPVTTFMVLFFASLIFVIASGGRSISASDSHTVYLSYDKQHATLPTRAKTVGEFLGRAGVTLSEGDIVEPASDTAIQEDNFHVNVYRAEPVMIVDGSQKLFAFSAASTARSVADQAGVKLYPEDNVTSQMSAKFLSEGSIGRTVVVDRAVPANLNVYGTDLAVRTHAKTVGDLLKEKHIVLAKDDTLQPSAATLLASADAKQIFVTRSGTKVQTVEEPIAMETEYVEDPKLSFGTTAVRQAGSPGKRLVTYQIDLKNDQEVGRRVIQNVVAVSPVKQIVARGKAVNIPSDKESVMAAAGISPSDYPYVNYIVSRESGWNAAANNKSSGAYGLCQALPGSKMASAGSDWQTNPVTQLRWCSGYANRYGGWAGAYNFWLAHKWW